MVRAVIFDLYDTLIDLPRDSQPFHQIARLAPNGDARARLEHSLTRPCTSLQNFAEQVGVDQAKIDFHQLEADLAKDLSQARLFFDVMETLNKLREQKVELGLISNLASPYKRPVFDLGLDEKFKVAIYSCDCGIRKPEEEIYRMAMQQMEIEPQDAVMVGDSYRSDVAGPNKIGLRGIHLLRSHQESRAEFQIKSLQEIFELI